MRCTTILRLLSPLLLVGVAACGGDDDDKSCDPIAETSSCDDGFVCEYVEAGEPACFTPLVIHGTVLDLSDDSAVAGAHIVALDVNGAPVSSVAISEIDGSYDLGIPSTRTADGVPMPLELTLRADGAGYQTFPSGLRQALPIDTANPAEGGNRLVVASALTDIGLIPLPDGFGTGTISGTVELPPNGAGVLVVAETAGSGVAAIANSGGDYTIFNVDVGNYAVTGYAQGVNYDGLSVDVAADGNAEANLTLNDQAAGTVSGSVQIVNAFGGAATSVILAIESTYDDTFGRGQTVPGLRAPEAGMAGNITGEYTIEGVPAGKYVALAAFEDDLLVRDPDDSIGGTVTLHIEVSAGQTTQVDGFKVTEALEILSPGANGAEEVAGTPVFTWVDDSSEDEYVVEVFDAFGESIWDTSIAGTSGTNPSVTYEGPALVSGLYYQFRATSYKGSPLSRTEDLKGVFFIP